MPSDRRGFTLLEMLVATTLLAVMAGILSLAFRLASDAVSRGEEAARSTARLRAGIDLLERAIRSADAMPVPGGGAGRICFRGERNRLRFLTASPPRAFAGEGLRILALRESERGEPLLSVDSPFRPEGAGGWEGAPEGRAILPGARRLALSYSAGPGRDGAWEWAESWDGEKEGRLPAAVRVELSTGTSDGGSFETAFVVPVFGGG